MDAQILQNQIDGFIAKGEELRKQEALFLKASGLDESIENAKTESLDLEDEIAVLKNEKEEKVALLNEAVSETSGSLAVKMGEVLPEGHAVFNIDKGKVFIGWKIDGNIKPYAGLSGGEKAVFDSALIHCFGCDVLIQESAELDKERLPLSIARLNEITGKQLLVNTCHAPEEVPEGWNVVAL